MMLNQRRIYCSVTMLFVAVTAFACASYPDEPRKPDVRDDTYIVAEDTFLAVSADKGILANDSPQEGERNYLIEVNGQKVLEGEQLLLDLDGGKVVLELDGSFTYEPNKNFNGSDQLSYKVRNDKGKEDTGTCMFQVTPVNDPPLAIDDRLPISLSPLQSIDVLSNDVDPDGDNIRISDIGTLENGSATIANDGMTILFAPNANHTGDVNFSYTITDEFNEEAHAWVLLTNGEEEGNNLVRPDAITVAEDSSVTLPFGRLLANDRVDPDADIEFGPAQNGTVQADGNRMFTYTPQSNFTGTDYFTYTVETHEGITASTTVTVTVTPVADAPTIVDIPNQRTGIGQTLGPILFTIANVDLSQTRLSVIATVSAAVPPNLIAEDNISIVGSGGSRAMWITPTPDLAGTATITITVSNGQAESSDAFQLTVGPVGPGPRVTVKGEFDSVITSDTSLTVGPGVISNEDIPYFQTTEDTPLNVSKARGLLANHLNNSDSTMRVIPSALKESDYGGKVQLKADGCFCYTPPPNFSGQDSFEYTLNGSDKGAAALSRKAVVLVTAVNDAPLAQNDLYGVPPGECLQIDAIQGVLSNDRDAEDHLLEVIPQNTDRLCLNADGSFTYMPAAGFSGRDLFKYAVSDGRKRANGTLTLVVGSIHVPMAQQADAYLTTGDGKLNIGAAKGLLANDWEPGGLPLFIYETGIFDTLFGGEVNIRVNGGFTYQPPLNFDGFDSFFYTLTNGHNSISQLAVISVTP